MKKSSVILLSGMAGCIAAFALFYLAGTASSRELMREPQPELAWLKKEFNLADAEYARIVALHQAYLPQCAERCRRIEELNTKLRQLVAASPSVTPEIQAVMAERAKMRADCEAEMLKHFLEVSRTMPPEQGRRYLSWIEQQTFLRGEAMEQQHRNANGSHQHH
jgi:hypothetical protein